MITQLAALYAGLHDNANNDVVGSRENEHEKGGTIKLHEQQAEFRSVCVSAPSTRKSPARHPVASETIDSHLRDPSARVLIRPDNESTHGHPLIIRPGKSTGEVEQRKLPRSKRRSTAQKRSSETSARHGDQVIHEERNREKRRG